MNHRSVANTFCPDRPDFQYLKKRLERGELELPKGSKGLSSFGREAGGQG